MLLGAMVAMKLALETRRLRMIHPAMSWTRRRSSSSPPSSSSPSWETWPWSWPSSAGKWKWTGEEIRRWTIDKLLLYILGTNQLKFLNFEVSFPFRRKQLSKVESRCKFDQHFYSSLFHMKTNCAAFSSYISAL